jgi:DNA polymerase type B, organellar and viral
MNKYGVDIGKVVSAPSLSLLIFRKNYLDTPIPILKRRHDEFIREAYYGGATDYYKVATLKGIKLKYYDINSLYPTAMMKPMPLNLIKIHKSLTLESFQSFFGFVKCKVTCPEGMDRPILPLKTDKGTIYPVGSWVGTYFSEEVRECIKLGYTFTFYIGYEFSKHNLFNRYVEEFYEEKRLATVNKDDAKKFISKLHFNSLYGIMGRKPDLITTVNSNRDGMEEISINRSIKKLITLTENIFIFLLKDNISEPLLIGMKELGYDIQSPRSIVMANVAVAAAITSYARIHMIPFKLHTDCYYTDTDSIFCSMELPSIFIGDMLGEMKDELEGVWIEDAIFLGLKQYGYSFIDSKSGKIIEKSVFRGVARNSLSLTDLKQLGCGGSIVRLIKNRFIRDFAKFQITIRDANLTITATRDKVIEGNNYLPPHVDFKESSKSLLISRGVGLLKGLFKLFVYHLSQVKKILSK